MQISLFNQDELEASSPPSDLLYLGPRCDYDARIMHSPTGIKWRDLEMYRNANFKEFNKVSTNFEPEELLNVIEVDSLSMSSILSHPYLTGTKLTDTLRDLKKWHNTQTRPTI